MEHLLNGELIPQGGGDNIVLTRSPLVLGRRESCDICLQFPNVSGKHCELSFKDGFWILRDMESKNGTKVNGTRMETGSKRVIHNGDLIAIGKRTFKLEYIETGRASDMEEYEDEVEKIVNTPLLERAGLAHPPRHARKPKIDPLKPMPKLDFGDDDDDDDD